MRRPAPALLAVTLTAALMTAACGSSPAAAPARPAAALPPPTSTPTPVPAAVPAAATPRPAWALGASPLATGPDGFGVRTDTPAALRRRTLQAPDLLPPPAGGRWAAVVAPVTPAVRARMGSTWSPACPVALSGLRLLTVAFHGFDGRPHSGQLVVAATVADDVVEVFRRLFVARFPLEEVRLPTTADLEAAPTGDGNLTAGLVCRRARGSTRWSAHARGLAVDVNPFQNPLVRRGLVLPELARSYADRSDLRPGMHVPGGPVVEAFEAVGWTWGGTWRSSRDWMHFSADGT